ncbi:hypothetical protein M422DRAFT_268301 [Sphaerobolus stellatus SS14]|uniref:Uncharacterized protein n=1 Tax=Sphaerobolus stellatus (strain SS14) TaxID=990650 RepID=A0A0C9UMV7_SPHS4|nr:hypothetical protein M422DRAFT_268301 [Sphaerobolus stellatus SS14]
MLVAHQPFPHPGASYPVSPSPNFNGFGDGVNGGNISPPPPAFNPDNLLGYGNGNGNGNGNGFNYNGAASHSLTPATSLPSFGPNVVKPLAVYPTNPSSGLASTITRSGSSPNGTGTTPFTVTSLTSAGSNRGGGYGGNAAVPSQGRQGQPKEGAMSVAIDFGTTFSGVAYGSSRIESGKIQQILNWPGSADTFRKIPTCLLYDVRGNVVAWGLEAKNRTAFNGEIKCEWFKLFLEPKVLRDPTLIDPRLPPLPPGKNPMDIIIDFLACLWEYAKQQITREIGVVADLDAADVWLTVPAAWDAKGCRGSGREGLEG